MSLSDNRFRILLVEDNEGDAALVEEYINEAGHGQFVLQRAKTLARGQQLLSEFAPHVILLDLNLPDSKGTDTLENFCAIPREQGAMRPPIVVLTSLDDQDVAMRAISGCAQDYLVKNDVNARVLLRSIRFAIQRHGRDEMDKILQDPDKSDGNQKEALQVLQRVNRTAPGEAGSSGDVKLPKTAAKHDSSLLLEHFSTGSKATEVIVTGLDQRIRKIEDGQHGHEVNSARRELLLAQLEKLLLGNGKGPLASRLESLERAVLSNAEENKDRKHTRTQWLVALIVLVVGWVGSIVAWLASYLTHSR